MPSSLGGPGLINIIFVLPFCYLYDIVALCAPGRAEPSARAPMMNVTQAQHLSRYVNHAAIIYCVRACVLNKPFKMDDTYHNVHYGGTLSHTQREAGSIVGN